VPAIWKGTRSIAESNMLIDFVLIVSAAATVCVVCTEVIVPARSATESSPGYQDSVLLQPCERALAEELIWHTLLRSDLSPAES
jgi:hypothetical protein